MAPQSTGRQLGTERQMGLTQEVFGRENVVAETGTGRCGDLEVPSWGQEEAAGHGLQGHLPRDGTEVATQGL